MTTRPSGRPVVRLGIPAAVLVPPDRAEITTCVQVADPSCATCRGIGALPTGALCPPCSVPVRLMVGAGRHWDYQILSPVVAAGRALVPLSGCATCRGTGRDGSGLCLPCAVVLLPEVAA